MTIMTQSITRVRDAWEKVHNLRIMLEDFQDGSPAPSVSLGRFTAAEMNAQITAAVELLTSMAVATTVVGFAVTGTATAAALATSQLTGTATTADLGTADVSSTAVWASDDEAIATVDTDGLVTGVAAGVCNITATYGQFSDVTAFTVT
jgi:hypothetical protein